MEAFCNPIITHESRFSQIGIAEYISYLFAALTKSAITEKAASVERSGCGSRDMNLKR